MQERQQRPSEIHQSTQGIKLQGKDTSMNYNEQVDTQHHTRNEKNVENGR
jgi:hypothetical protein